MELNSAIDDLELSWTNENGQLLVAVYGLDGTATNFEKGDLFTVYFDGTSHLDENELEITRAEFSDQSGAVLSGDYNIKITENYSPNVPDKTGLSVMGYPNPFNSSITISYELPREGFYDLVIFDILGREVRTLMNGYKSSGGGAIIWDGTDNGKHDVASGIYFARLRGEAVSASLKLFLMK